MVNEETKQLPISREQEQALYAYLREATGTDALRYQVIAQKIAATADGTASDAARDIALNWLRHMESERDARAARESTTQRPKG